MTNSKQKGTSIFMILLCLIIGGLLIKAAISIANIYANNQTINFIFENLQKESFSSEEKLKDAINKQLQANKLYQLTVYDIATIRKLNSNYLVELQYEEREKWVFNIYLSILVNKQFTIKGD